MASTLPQIATECCPPVCTEPTTVQVPGPAGPSGTNGTNGINGVNPFTTFITSSFVIPAELATGVAAVAGTSWMVQGQKLYGSRVDGSIHAFFEVSAIGGATSVTLKNLEDAATSSYLENSPPGSTLIVGSKLGPAGIQGPNGNLTGAASGDLKGTYPGPKIGIANAKGSSLWGNGTDIASVAAGTNGHMLAYDSTDAEGIKSFKAIPLTGDTNVSTQRIARLSATTGLPIPIESSKAIINEPGVAAGEKGALVLDVSAGNARGVDAVDLQVNRSAGATKIAGGARNFIGGGQNNLTGNSDSAVVGGESNTASAQRAFVGAGISNQATGQDSFVGGGNSNIVTVQVGVVAGGNANVASTGTAATIGGGEENLATGAESFIPGGFRAKADKWGQFAHASGYFAAQGDAQASEFVMRNATVNATPTELFLDGSATRLVVPTNTSWMFQIMLVARKNTGLTSIYKSEGQIENTGGVVTASAITTTELNDGIGLPATPVAVAADDPNNALIITCTGLAATNLRWVAVVKVVECSY